MYITRTSVRSNTKSLLASSASIDILPRDIAASSVVRFVSLVIAVPTSLDRSAKAYVVVSSRAVVVMVVELIAAIMDTACPSMSFIVAAAIGSSSVLVIEYSVGLMIGIIGGARERASESGFVLLGLELVKI